jgi:hypothetical protein
MRSPKAASVAMCLLISACALSPQQSAVVSQDVNTALVLIETITPALAVAGIPPALIPVAEAAEQAALKAFNDYMANQTVAGGINASLEIGDSAVTVYAMLPTADPAVVTKLKALDVTAHVAVAAWNAQNTAANQAAAEAAVGNLTAAVAAERGTVTKAVKAIRVKAAR